METIQKELDKLHKRLPGLVEPTTRKPPKDSSSNVFHALDRLIDRLEAAHQQLTPHHQQQHADGAAISSASPSSTAALSHVDLNVLLAELRSEVELTQHNVADRQREFYGALSKLGKALEKKFPTSASKMTDPALFSSLPAQHALESVVLEHFLRQGDWDLAKSFAEEAHMSIPSQAAANFEVLHSTIRAIMANELDPAIVWAERERTFLTERSSIFEYALHRSRFLHIALGVDTRELEGMMPVPASQQSAAMALEPSGINADPDGEMVDMMEESVYDLRTGATNAAAPASDWAHTNVDRALFYARRHFNSFSSQHLPEIQKLLTLLLFMPVIPIKVTRPTGSTDPEPSAPIALEDVLDFVPAPYRVFLDSDKMHAPFLAPLFKAEFCMQKGISKDPPLRVAVDLGAGGAFNKILKVRTVMKESGTDWSQADELPIEIPLPTQLRFHSIFCCPVSKEQGTDDNPPMMMACGHVVCKESLNRLSKGSGEYRKVKCPYCPIESTVGQAMRLYF